MQQSLLSTNGLIATAKSNRGCPKELFLRATFAFYDLYYRKFNYLILTLFKINIIIYYINLGGELNEI